MLQRIGNGLDLAGCPGFCSVEDGLLTLALSEAAPAHFFAFGGTAPAHTPTRPPMSILSWGGRVGVRAGAGNRQKQNPGAETGNANQCNGALPAPSQ